MDILYDVAISFLSGDEPLASRLHNALSENLRVFVYSKRQEELAGTDGLESFRQAFLRSGLLVVLYRDGWGKTRWTAVEELAIKDRMFKGDWGSLLFVMLDEQSVHPAWLPDTHVRLNCARFGNDLIGAIKLRAVELGRKLVAETALDNAQRIEAIRLSRRERESKLTYQASDAFAAEWKNLHRLLDEKLSQIQPSLSTLMLERGSDADAYVIRTGLTSLDLRVRNEHPGASEAQVMQRTFVGRLILPKDTSVYMYVTGDEPQCFATSLFWIDYNAAIGWCWRSRDTRQPLLSTEALSERVIKSILQFHEQVELGKVKHVRHERRVIHPGQQSWMS
jgi:hypothetical protein